MRADAASVIACPVIASKDQEQEQGIRGCFLLRIRTGCMHGGERGCLAGACMQSPT